ncbi:MAG: glycoside hydrolase family 3 C-terminal domain-containing protein [Thermotogae bacterium]|nr:glycoside hydrolase family 3 C-terminal domain-containing protein [Thermotogota bacterium]
MQRNIKELVSKMTLEEKASLCSGLDFWHTKSIERLGIPSIMMTDGPHGLRKVSEKGDTVPATCFPTAVALASSWDEKLLEKVGEAIAKECLAEGVSILLGPGVNIKRSPLCGRNFEYYSEDPYLSSEMAASFIKGVQSKGVGASLKHFVANNQEHRRMSISAMIDERTLREIYLASFEGAIKKSRPWTVMAAYNRVNGKYCFKNEYLLTDILRNEWGFEGIVISDWGAVDTYERAEALKAGLDLEMPSSNGLGDKKIIEAVRNGKLSEEILDKTVERLLTIIFEAIDNKQENATYDRRKHHEFAKEVAKECIVLLKNENNILPLNSKSKVAVIGSFAKNVRYQGGGSSHVNPTQLDIPYEEILKLVDDPSNVLYADGYDLESDEVKEELINEAKNIAQNSDVAVIFAGLPERYESEGYDRENLSLPKSHNKLIEEITKVQDNVVVVLFNGAPVEMPWINKVKGLFECYLGGQAVGGAIADLLFGKANPSGKLAETFPKKLAHNPSHPYFPGEDDMVEYREGIFIGYRYYDKKEIEPLFPFGFGLSYTKFEYSDLKIDKKQAKDTDTITVSVKVKNVGNMAGKEIVQLYVRDVESSVVRPEKELKGFKKVELNPGEEKTVTFVLDKRSFAYYSTDIKDWYVESGDFEILIGKSSKEIVLKDTVNVESTLKIRKKFTRNSTVGDLMEDPIGSKILSQLIEQFSKNSPIGALNQTNPEFFLSLLKYMPLRGLVTFSRGMFTEEMLDDILKQLNS